jgi:predicted Fe-Mo cluster-binding NifX family protein
VQAGAWDAVVSDPTELIEKGIRMKLAIPTWEGKVSPVFDTATRLLVLQVDEKKEKSRFETYLDEQNISKRCFRIQCLGVDVLICGAISQPLHRRIVATGTQVIPWISGTTNEVIDAYVNGSLNSSRFLMPGCQGQNKEFACEDE